jgi:hypothetical protein
VSKRRDAPYRSGERRDWRKVKTLAWREANQDDGDCPNVVSSFMLVAGHVPTRLSASPELT